MVVTEFDYNPNQPRDSEGRWGSGLYVSSVDGIDAMDFDEYDAQYPGEDGNFKIPGTGLMVVTTEDGGAHLRLDTSKGEFQVLTDLDPESMREIADHIDTMLSVDPDDYGEEDRIFIDGLPDDLLEQELDLNSETIVGVGPDGNVILGFPADGGGQTGIDLNPEDADVLAEALRQAADELEAEFDFSPLPVRAAVARAALALAYLAVFDFNPHQRRGPDGRWIKMGTGEKKPPRRRGASRAAGVDAAGIPLSEYEGNGPPRKAAVRHPAAGIPPVDRSIPGVEGWQQYGLFINDRLRGVEKRQTIPAERAASITADLDAMFTKLPSLKKDTVVWRGVQDVPSIRSGQERSIFGDADATGKAFDDLGFQSASTSQDAARNFTGIGGGQTLIKLTLPKGTKAARMSGNLEREGEVLLPRGTRIRVTRDHMVDGVRHLEAVVEKSAQAGDGDARPAPKSGRKSPTVAYAERQDDLGKRLKSGKSGSDPISDGIMGDTFMVTLKDGSKTIYKKAKADWDLDWTTKDQTDAEELGSVVAAAIGVNAPAVQRVDDRSIFMEVMPGETAVAAFVNRGQGLKKQIVDSDDGIRMGMLDALIGNPDRHDGNYLVDRDNTLSAIDHGLAFRVFEDTPYDFYDILSSPFARAHFVDQSGDLTDNDLSRSDIAKVRERLKEQRKEFERLGRGQWFDKLLLRLDEIGRKAVGAGSVIR